MLSLSEQHKLCLCSNRNEKQINFHGVMRRNAKLCTHTIQATAAIGVVHNLHLLFSKGQALYLCLSMSFVSKRDALADFKLIGHFFPSRVAVPEGDVIKAVFPAFRRCTGVGYILMKSDFSCLIQGLRYEATERGELFTSALDSTF